MKRIEEEDKKKQ